MTTNYMNDGFKIINNQGEEEIIQIPYNINNKLATENDIISILNKYCIKVDKINDISLFHKGFTHKSYCKKQIYPDEILLASKKEINNPNLLELRDENNQVLEFFGDKVLKLSTSYYLIKRYPKLAEGDLTKIQSKLENRVNLAVMCRDMEISKYFIISRQIENNNGRNSEKMLEDCIESFFGALFLSNGLEPSMLLIVNLLETLIDFSDKLYCDSNYKDILLRHHHSQEWKHPKYDKISQYGPAHKRKFIVGVQRQDFDENTSKKDLKSLYIGFGNGNSHKEAEQQAAKMALIIHGVLNEDQYTQSDIYYPDNINSIESTTEIKTKNNDDSDTESVKSI
jgi:ribonuclease-3